MKKFSKGSVIIISFALVIFIGGCVTSDVPPSIDGKIIAPVQADYPHWDFNNWDTYKKLVKVNTFIEINKDQGYIAVFDWDGTLYNENIAVKEMNEEKFAGQPAWYIWSAYNVKNFSFPVFPMFKTKDGEFLNNVINEDNYLEGRTNIKADQYSKFTTTSIFTAGMTQENMSEAVKGYLEVYRPEKYAFLPMLDIMQKMVDSGFDVWIVTGSNQYFVAEIVNYIESNIKYTEEKNYKFNLCTVPYNATTGHIAGNGLKLLKNNTFSVVYDNRYVANSEKKLYIVDDYGKEVVVKNLEKKAGKKIIFAAGNSGGDYYDISYVIGKSDGIAIAVEPRGTLEELAKDYPNKIVSLDSKEI